jgi:hypothetical protein
VSPATTPTHRGGAAVSTELMKRPRDGKDDERPRIAHIRDWALYDATGEIKGLCGTRLKGVPAVGYQDRCVVCLSLDNSEVR